MIHVKIAAVQAGYAVASMQRVLSIPPVPQTDRPDAGQPPTAPARAALPELDALTLLDDAQEWAAFSKPCATNADWIESSVVVQGMTCAACAVTVEDVLRATPGVVRAEVSAGSQRANVWWAPAQVLPSQWMQAVRHAGYAVVPANDLHALALRRRESRLALWRWAVAGLCMMQVMMYAYPAYTAPPGDLSAEMEQLLRWASWVLTLPVILFSCGPFFRNALRDLAQRRVSMDLPVALGMAITFLASTAGTFDPTGVFGREVFFDSLTMFVFFLLSGRWLELRLRDRTAGALDSVMNRLPDRVQRVGADGCVDLVSARQLRVGDTIQVIAGDAFPADGVVIRGHTAVDESLLTGESRALDKGPGDAVVTGSHNLSGMVAVRVERLGDETRFAQIVALMRSAATTRPRLAQQADRLAKPFLMAVLLAALGAGVYWWPQDPGHAVMVAVAVLIVTCPCALSLATPAAMLAAAGNLARGGVLVRRLQAIEALAGADTVLFDKTGTLTTERLQVDSWEHREGVSQAEVGTLAWSLASRSCHPVSMAITRYCAALAAGERLVVDALQETAGRGISARVAWQSVGGRASLVRLGSASFCGLTPTADGPSLVHLADEGGWLASFSLAQDVRPDAAATVAALRTSGLQLAMVSGDAAAPAKAVAAIVGIDDVTANCAPDAKLQVVHALQAQGRRVVMVADGINDAPVLAAADVSFAFGKSVPLAQSQADFVVPGERLGAIVQTIVLARRTMRVVRQNLWWALAYNMACIPLAVAGWLPAWLAGLGMAASSLLVVLNALRLARRQPLSEAGA